jgi:hypothetical protein
MTTKEIESIGVKLPSAINIGKNEKRNTLLNIYER